MHKITSADILDELRAYSAKIGADDRLIQGAGGNTSVKEGPRMWIKASGTQLQDALVMDIFVPVDWRAIANALTDDPAQADRPDQFLLAKGLRPSIETSLHALLPARVVIHVHCVNTIALAMRGDAKAQIAARLQHHEWAFVPYAKPGAPLALAVRAAAGPETNVFVLGNHGLLLAANTVADAALLLDSVVASLRVDPDEAPPAIDPDALNAHATRDYLPAPPGDILHHMARDPERLALALGGGLYPDQVLFCGPRMLAVVRGQTSSQTLAALEKAGTPQPVVLLVPGLGALVRKDATPTGLAMAKSVGDVMMRVPKGAKLTYISDVGCADLLNWDAEKYRLTLSFS